ncbi:MAG: F0F1 ATP synthase subunit B [Calditrichia bacterium]|nr:F0F1 ATP synthase subunit B [Calditrichia bacterium]
MDQLLSVNPGMAIWTWIIFLLLFTVLAKFAWKPLLSAVEKREKSIEDSLQRAEQVKDDAEKLIQKHKEMIEEAHQQSQQIIKESKEAAEKIKADMETDTKEKVDKMFLKAHADIENEKKSALQELRREVVQLSVQISEKIILESLDETKHRKLIDDYIDNYNQKN